MTSLPTQFAPAERAPKQQLEEDAQLFARESLICMMLDAVPEIVLVLNPQRQAVFANDAVLHLLRLASRDDAVGQRPGELIGCVHAGEHCGCGTSEFCRTCGAVNAVLRSLKGSASTQECRIPLKNGDALDLRATARPIQLDGKLFSVFTLQDISGEKRRQVLEKIFFHDVLNTAGIVSMCAATIEEDPALTSDVIAELSRSAQRLVDEIQNQRDLLAAENGELKPRPDMISVQAFMRDLSGQCARHQVAEGRRVELVEPDEALTLIIDETLLGRVIGNMIKNALEASDPGQTVTLSCTVVDGGVRFAVHNPTPMPVNIQLQIFNRSFSTKGIGRGLGTYSMKLLSERYLHGHVEFESSPETGTTFTATYPIEAPGSAAGGPETQPSE